MSNKTPKLFAVAIHIGSTNSGYALSSQHDFELDPTKIRGHNWQAGNMYMASKIPTCLLLKPDRTFDSFGFEAEDNYEELRMDDDHHGWYFFRHFKRQLYKNKVSNCLLYPLQEQVKNHPISSNSQPSATADKARNCPN